MALLLLIGAVAALLPHTQFLKDLFNYDELPETLQDRGYQIAVSAISLSIFAIGFILICCMKRQIAICTYLSIQLSGSSRPPPISSGAAVGHSSSPSISPSSSFSSSPSGYRLPSSFSHPVRKKSIPLMALPLLWSTGTPSIAGLLSSTSLVFSGTSFSTQDHQLFLSSRSFLGQFLDLPMVLRIR